MKFFTFIVFFHSITFCQLSLDSTLSTISYKGSHPFHKWKGVSNEITILQDCNQADLLCNIEISVPIISFDSKNTNRDSNMLYYLNGYDYPSASLKIVEFDLNSLKKVEDSLLIAGVISIKGIKKEKEFFVELIENNNNIRVRSNFDIKLEDFDISVPTLLLIPINQTIKIEVDFYLNKYN